MATPTERKRADALENGHRLGYGQEAELLRRSMRGRKPQGAPPILDLTYRSICRGGKHWLDEDVPEPIIGKSFVFLHAKGEKRVVLEDLEPAMWGAPPNELAKRATVYCAAEPGIAIFQREWAATFGRSGR